MPKYIDIRNASDNAKVLIAKEVAKDIKEGKIVVFPTETVYGLASSMDESNVNRIFEIKGRERTKPLPIMIGNVKDIEMVADKIPHIFYELANKYMPGPLTVVLKKKDWVSDIITGGRDTVGVRMPDHIFALNLIRFVGAPIIATSANLSGNPSPKDFLSAQKDMINKADVFVDGGECLGGTPSTIVDLLKEKPTVLRQGSIDLSEYIK